MEIWSFIGYGIMILIALGVIALVGYGILCFFGATIGGILTLLDKIKADSILCTILTNKPTFEEENQYNKNN